MNFQEWLKDYFTFTRKERIALIIVMAIIASVWLLPKVLSPKPNTTLGDTSWITAAKKLQRQQNTSQSDSEEKNENVNDFAFDKAATYRANSQGENYFTLTQIRFPWMVGRNWECATRRSPLSKII